jgi:hypothetical protein
MENIFFILELAFRLIGLLLMLAVGLLIIAMPLLIVFAIYKAIKSLMTHNANLKNQQGNDRWNPESR